MSEMSRDDLLGAVRRMWEERDPVPMGLVDRMRALVASEVALQRELDVDLDYELLVLVERSSERAGTRAADVSAEPRVAYTLQYAHGDFAMLVRVAGEEQPGEGGRLDGWLAPPAEMAVRVLRVGDDDEWEAQVDARGRFEFRDLPSGLFRLCLYPREPGARPFVTPAFEL